MNNRIPIFVLGILVFVALVSRIVNPPAPLPPGPMGGTPNWRSSNSIGEMTDSAVNPSGTVWAGVWNEKTKKSGTLRSAVWVIDLENSKTASYSFKDGSYVPNISWADDKTVRALRLDTNDAVAAKESEIVYIDAGTSKADKKVMLKTAVARVLDWPAGSDKFIAQIADAEALKIAILSDSGEIIGKEVNVNLPKDAQLYDVAGMSPNASQIVFSSTDNVGGNETFYLADAVTGLAKGAITKANDVPGRVEDVWVSDKGYVLLAYSTRSGLGTLVYNPAAGKVANLRKSGVDVKKNWPDAPKDMKFVAYDGGYTLDLNANGKIKDLFDLSKLNRRENYWLQDVQGGRLYPRKDGGYTSVSTIANEVDIRILSKDGTRDQDILRR